MTATDSLDALLDALEQQHGTAGLEDAWQRWQHAAAARLAGLHHDRDLRAARSTATFLDHLGLPEYAAAIRVNPTPWPTSAPFPTPREAATP